MTGEHDARNSNQMENNSQHWTSPEDGLLLDRNVYRRDKKNGAYKLENFVLFTNCHTVAKTFSSMNNATD